MNVRIYRSRLVAFEAIRTLSHTSLAHNPSPLWQLVEEGNMQKIGQAGSAPPDALRARQMRPS